MIEINSNAWDETLEDMKDAVRKDRELWLNIFGEEFERTGNHSIAESLANQNLEKLGTIKIDGSTMNGDLINKMDNDGWW